MKKTTDFSYAEEMHDDKPWYVVNIDKYQMLFFVVPLLPIFLLFDKIDEWCQDRLKWDDAKATKMLDYILPHKLEYVDDTYYYCMSWYYWSFFECVPLRYKSWVKKHSYSLHQFVLDGYKRDGYDKTIENADHTDDLWVCFRKHELNQNK